MHWLLIPLAFLSTGAFAHGGGLDRYGCHHDRKVGGYHCHRGPNDGKHYGSKSEMLKPKAVVLAGHPTVVDGDTIRIESTRIRLHGIDAPESQQTCQVDDKPWQCGKASTEALKDAIGTQHVSCSKRDMDRYGRVVAVCRAGSIDLNAWMVLQGWAIAYRHYSNDYVSDEQVAQQARRGVWQGDFVMPWEWRSRRRR